LIWALAKRDAVVPKVAQGLGIDQGVDGCCWPVSNIERLSAQKSPFGQRSEYARPLAVPDIHLPVGRSPPAFGHINLGARDWLSRRLQS
jgi:hypothetical protein